jgi:hypothetical protein
MIFYRNRQRYGTRRITAVLSREDIPFNRGRMAYSMQQRGLFRKIKRVFKVTTDLSIKRRF